MLGGRFQHPAVRRIFAADPVLDTRMNAAPEFANIVATVGIFLAVFAVSNLLARARGYRD